MSVNLDSTLPIASQILIAEMGQLLHFWKRLEPISRTSDFSRAIQAQIKDPLWMITRQWQWGEFQGEDAASPIDVQLQYKTSQITRILLGNEQNGTVKSTFDESGEILPIEELVEREKISNDVDAQLILNWRTRVQIGQQFERILQDDNLGTDVSPIISEFNTHFKIPLDPATIPNYSSFDNETKDFLNILKGKSIDGIHLFSIINNIPTNPEFPNGFNLTDEQKTIAQLALDKTGIWFSELYPKSKGDDVMAWQHDDLDYSFAVSAPWDSASEEQKVLVGKDYDGNPDWYTFSLKRDDNTRLGDEPLSDDEKAKISESESLHFIPTNLTFSGMPNSRWWEFEDREVDLGKMDVSTTDLGKILLLEYALVHSNDWYIIPLELDLGSLCKINSLVITDVFGDTIALDEVTDESQGWRGWNMFGISKQELPIPSDQFYSKHIDIGDFLFIPPTFGNREESKLEEVRFFRDEMANLIWAVEHTVTNGLGNPKPGYEQYRDKNQSGELHLEENQIPIPYKLSSIVPDNWIPFIPEHSDAFNRSIQLRQGRMPRNSEDSVPVIIEPQTHILLSAGDNHSVNEEAITRSGLRIQMNYQRARWTNGRVHSWLGRTIKAGEGEGSSGLKFDFVKELENKEDE